MAPGRRFRLAGGRFVPCPSFARQHAQGKAQPRCGAFGGLGIAKGRQTEIALALWPKAHARRAGHARRVQQVFKQRPRAHAARRFQPQIGAVFAPAIPHARLLQRRGKHLCIFAVGLNVFCHCRTPPTA